MKHLVHSAALVAIIALAACSSGPETTTTGGTTGGTAGGTPVSRIFDITLPDAAAMAMLPTSAQDTINDFETRNQMAVATNPTGGSVYFGRTVMEVGDIDTDGALVEGDVYLGVDFGTSQVNGQFQDLTVNDLNGNVETVDVIRINATTITDGRYSTTLSTDPVTVAGGTANQRTATVDATLDGAFVEGGAGTIGVIGGTVTVGSGPAESLNGVYTADSN